MIDDSILKDLLKRISNGDESAFEELVNKTEKSVFSVAYNMLGSKQDALDVCQEVYIKLFKYLGSYKIDKQFNIWLYKITVNCCYSFIKNKGQEFSSLEDLKEEFIFNSPSMDEELSNKQLLTKALNFLKLLTPNERAVFILRDVNNLSTKEIAKILSCTQITVRRHSNNARKKLKKFLQSNKTIFF